MTDNNDSLQPKEEKFQEDQETGLEKNVVVESQPNAGWYIVYCQVGKEAEIKNSLEEKIKSSTGMEQKILEVLVPEEEEIQIRKGKKVVIRKAPYKGYMYIKMVMEPSSYWFVRSTPGIKGFLGGRNPEPMSEKEVSSIKSLSEKLKGSQPKIAKKFNVGDTVRIIDGPFKHFSGVVEEISDEKAKVKMVITVFGRPTPVELDFAQVEKI
jgi:transcriptional antiterminator NusG